MADEIACHSVGPRRMSSWFAARHTFGEVETVAGLVEVRSKDDVDAPCRCRPGVHRRGM